MQKYLFLFSPYFHFAFIFTQYFILCRTVTKIRAKDLLASQIYICNGKHGKNSGEFVKGVVWLIGSRVSKFVSTKTHGKLFLHYFVMTRVM